MADKIGSLKFDAKSLTAAIGTLRSTRKKFEKLLHTTVVAAIARAIVYKDANTMTRLIAAIGGKDGVTIIRANTVIEWVQENAPLVWVEDRFKMAKQGAYEQVKAEFDADPVAFIDNLLETPIQESKPEPKYKDFDLLSHMIKQVQSMSEDSESMQKRKAAGKSVNLSDKAAILEALLAIEAKRKTNAVLSTVKSASAQGSVAVN